jgi:hypothetical protein
MTLISEGEVKAIVAQSGKSQLQGSWVGSIQTISVEFSIDLGSPPKGTKQRFALASQE